MMKVFGRFKKQKLEDKYYPDDPDKPYGSSGLTDDIIIQVKGLSRLGLSQKQVAEAVNGNYGTFCEWLKKYEPLVNAWNEGVLSRRQRAFTCYMEQAFPMEKDKKTGKFKPSGKGNPALMIQYMKSVEGWSETSKQIVEDDRQDITELDAQAKYARIKKLEEKLKK